MPRPAKCNPPRVHSNQSAKGEGHSWTGNHPPRRDQMHSPTAKSGPATSVRPGEACHIRPRAIHPVYTAPGVPRGKDRVRQATTNIANFRKQLICMGCYQTPAELAPFSLALLPRATPFASRRRQSHALPQLSPSFRVWPRVPPQWYRPRATPAFA
jgi:hypothetical protein